MMQVNEAVNFISHQLREQRHITLSKEASQHLHDRLDQGRERALKEKNEAFFDGSVHKLSSELMNKLSENVQAGEFVGLQAGEVESLVPARTSVKRLNEAFFNLCPLWPFC